MPNYLQVRPVFHECRVHSTEIQMSQSFKLTLSYHRAVPEKCSAITEAVLHEVSSRERDN